MGYVSQTLTAAGQQATAYNLSVTVPLPILGEADEIFQGRKPCLTLVDGRSFLVVTLTPAESHDGTIWGVTCLDLVERGIQFHDLACDGGTGLRAGVKEAQLAIPLRPDLFHILQGAHRSHLSEAIVVALTSAKVEYVVIDKCGHFWHERPDAFFSRVRTFLGLSGER
jgi:hypothetical protein